MAHIVLFFINRLCVMGEKMMDIFWIVSSWIDRHYNSRPNTDKSFLTFENSYIYIFLNSIYIYTIDLRSSTYYSDVNFVNDLFYLILSMLTYRRIDVRARKFSTWTIMKAGKSQTAA